MTDWAVDKPPGFYLSSFRCVSAFVAKRVAEYAGPYPYIDGLLLQVTQQIGSIAVRHDPRRAGKSTYTLRRLVRLWLSAWVNFSLLPLRVATALGLVIALAGLVGFGWVVYWRLTDQGPTFGWGSIMSALLIFSGTQLVLLGLIGEYVGRMFLTVNQRPQAVVRAIVQATIQHRGTIHNAETHGAHSLARQRWLPVLARPLRRGGCSRFPLATGSGLTALPDPRPPFFDITKFGAIAGGPAVANQTAINAAIAAAVVGRRRDGRRPGRRLQRPTRFD